MDHGTIFLDVLTVSNRLRHLDAAKVASIAASMDEIGLQQPVSVWASDDGAIVELVAGAHRVAAANKLGWEKIDCIFVNMNELDRRLWEIDENLIRADLTDLERAQHTAKRAEVVKQKVILKPRRTGHQRAQGQHRPDIIDGQVHQDGDQQKISAMPVKCGPQWIGLGDEKHGRRRKQDVRPIQNEQGFKMRQKMGPGRRDCLNDR